MIPSLWIRLPSILDLIPALDMLIFKSLSRLLKITPRITNGELKSLKKAMKLMLLKLLHQESELVRKKMSKSKMELSKSETKFMMKVSFVIGVSFTQVTLEMENKEMEWALVLPMTLLMNSDNVVNN